MHKEALGKSKFQERGRRWKVFIGSGAREIGETEKWRTFYLAGLALSHIARQVLVVILFLSCAAANPTNAQNRLVLVGPNMQKGAENDLLISCFANPPWQALSFSLEYDTNQLEFLYITNQVGALTWVFTNGIGPGRVGVILAASGTNNLLKGAHSWDRWLRARFRVTTNSASSTEIRLGNQPVLCEGIATNGEHVALERENATVWRWEKPQRFWPWDGDVFPLFTTNYLGGDGEVRFLDGVITSDTLIGLHEPVSEFEFEAMDTAPRQSLGDGAITLADYVQFLRYFMDWDAPRYAGGPPRTPYSPTQSQPVQRVVRFESRYLIIGENNDIPIDLGLHGDEAAAAFTISFDPSILEFKGFTSSASPAIRSNTNQTPHGKLAMLIHLVDMKPGDPLRLSARFFCKTSAPPATTLSFDDSIALRQICDTNALVLPTAFQNATLSIGHGYLANPIFQNGNLEMTFKGSSASEFVIEFSSDLLNWSQILTITNASASLTFSNTLPNPPKQFYRARPLASGAAGGNVP